MEQKYFLKTALADLWGDVHLMYDLIHCYDVPPPFVLSSHSQVTESFCPANFCSCQLSPMRWASEIKRARPLRRKLERDLEKKLEKWVGFRVFPLFQLPRSPTSQEVMFLTIQVKGPTQEFKSGPQCWLKMKSLVFVQTDKPIYKQSRQVQRPIVRTTSQKFPTSSLACFPVKGILVP